MIPFEKEIEVRWADCDANRHVRHSAYYDYGAFVRIRFFSELGFGADQLSAINLGPILFKEECSFIREILPEDVIRVNLLRGPVSEDGSRWVLHHEIMNQNGVKNAHITIKGAWIDLEKRKLAVPPKALAEAILSLPEGEPYVYVKS